MELKKYTSKNKFIDSLILFFTDIFFYSVRAISRKRSEQNNKFLIISLHKIGDSIFTIPAIKEILKEFKDKEIFLLVLSETKVIFEEIIDGNYLYTVDKKEFKIDNRIASKKSRMLIKNIDPDIIVDLTCTITSAFLIFNSKSNRIIGTNDRYFKNIYSDFINIRKVPHLIELYTDVAELLLKRKVNQKLFEYVLDFSKEDSILIHPFAGWAAKEWDIKKYIWLAEQLGKNYRVSIIFHENEASSETINYFVNAKIDFIKTKTLSDLINRIKNCSVFIGNDSGPLYLANYYGKPTFTIYGPTNPDYSKPFGSFHMQVRKIIDCSPVDTQYCFLSAGRECPSYQCMIQLDENIVAEKIFKFITDLEISTLQ